MLNTQKQLSFSGNLINDNLWSDRKWLILMFLFFVLNSIIIPRPINLIIPYTCLGIALFSQDKIRWLVFFLFIVEFPGGFFFQMDQSFVLFSKYYVSLFGVFSCCFIILNLFKGNRRIKNNRYKAALLLFIAYFMGMFLYSIARGMTFVRILDILFNFIPFLWIVVLGNIFKSYSDIKRFILLSSTLIYFHVISQIFVIISGVELVSVFTNSAGRELGNRVAYGSISMMVGTIGNLILYNIEKKRSWIYLFNVLLFSLSFFLTATRGYIIAIGIIVIFTLLYRFRISLLKIVIASIIIIALIIIFKLDKPIRYSISRLNSLESVYEGDLTAKGTLNRITERGPKVMEQFKKSPIFGFAFTDTSYKYSDPHVGNQNLLLNAGISGFLIVIFLLIRFIYILQKHKSNNNKFPLTIIQLSMLGYFIIHSTSSQIFSFSPGSSFIRVAILFAWAEIFLSGNFIPEWSVSSVSAEKHNGEVVKEGSVKNHVSERFKEVFGLRERNNNK